MSTFPLSLEQYFFPHQEVRANPSYDQQGNRAGSVVTPEYTVKPIDGRPDSYYAELKASLDEAESDNPPYFFTVVATGIFISDRTVPPEAALALAQNTGLQILVGVLRERLASITSRGPWGVFTMGVMPIVFAPTSATKTNQPLTK